MSKSDLPAIRRRTVFAGAGAVGALGAIAAATGLSRAVPAVEPAAKLAEAKPPETGGYQLTDHVKQYYAKARI
jgi:poly(3-hydroxybutyrate) depolymerase